MSENAKKPPLAGFREEAAMPYSPDEDHGGPQPSAVERVRRRHERALLGLPGVTGVGTGQTPIGDDALVVYLERPDAGRPVPAELDGYPVQTVVTGPIDAG